MGLRWKIALSLAVIALTATTAVGLIGYRTTSMRLYDEVDRSLNDASNQLGQVFGGRVFQNPNPGLLEVYWVRIFGADGSLVASSFVPDRESERRPVEVTTVDNVASEVVGVNGARRWTTVDLGDGEVRVYTFATATGAIQIGRSLDEVHSVLDDLRSRTVVLVVLVSVVAAVLGWLIASTVSSPLRRLTRAAADVGASGRLDVDVPGAGRDEVGRLGAAFRDMLGALGRSRAEQQRLVQDAGHELRTPLTSLKTNLSVLRRYPDMDADTRAGVFDDLDSEVTELTDLVNELVAVASGELEDQVNEELNLVEVAQEVADRVARRRTREITVRAVAPAVVEAPPSALGRAVTNLIDNACKFDQSGEPIVVDVNGGTLTVLDRGPGVSPDECERIFDRFHRTDAARSMPGSGLGLSIVREVVERANGSVFARARAGGGSEIGFTLPAAVPYPLAPGVHPSGGSGPLPPPGGASN